MSEPANTSSATATEGETPNVSPEEKVLVQVEVVRAVRRHNNAERLVVCTVLGYQVIVNPEVWGMTVDEAVARDLNERPMKGLMFFVDAMIPTDSPFFNHEMFAFLSECYGGRRVRTIKLRGEISQGLFLSFENANRLVEKNWENVLIGTNVTNDIGVRKYMAKEDPEYVGKNTTTNLLPFPILIPKTDEPHLQRAGTYVLDADRRYVTTLKLDGQSVTFFYDGNETGFCSRNYQLREGAQSYALIDSIEKKFRIFEQMIDFGMPMAIQGELYGLGINGNRLAIPDVRFAVFNIFALPHENQTSSYLNHSDVMQVCAQMNLPTVPVLKIGMGNEFPSTLEGWLEWADSLTWGVGIHSRLDLPARSASLLAEGMVVKTCSGERMSAKVISRAYLLKHSL